LITSIYGFGSYFNGSGYWNDIDILIVHDSADREACLNAISLKKYIVNEIENADVSILSKSTEVEFDFIAKSHASLLFEFEGDFSGTMIREIVNALIFFQK